MKQQNYRKNNDAALIKISIFFFHCFTVCFIIYMLYGSYLFTKDKEKINYEAKTIYMVSIPKRIYDSILVSCYQKGWIKGFTRGVEGKPECKKTDLYNYAIHIDTTK